jgi:regulator-associated protein of mTOR
MSETVSGKLLSFLAIILLIYHSIWDWEQKMRMSRFSNGNPVGSKINDVKFINEDDQALLLTGSSDGVIKIFRDYDSEDKVELVSAFRGLYDLVPSSKNVGLVFDWQQGQGKLLVAGDVKVIRIWNAATEICTNVSTVWLQL